MSESTSGDRTGANPPSESTRELWNDHADWWTEEFTDGVDPEYTEQIVPLVVDAIGGPGRVLDIGTGEGQVARALRESGSDVIGIDPTLSLLATARERDGGTSVAAGVAGGLPVADGSIDRALACLVFEHVPDVGPALAEVARVLAPGGRFLFLLNHPLLQTPGSGWIDDQVLDPPEQYWRIGPYLPEASTVEEVQKDVFIRFHHRPLSTYLNALRAEGLWLDRMDEPAPPPGFLSQTPWYTEAATVPRLLALHLVKLAT